MINLDELEKFEECVSKDTFLQQYLESLVSAVVSSSESDTRNLIDFGPAGLWAVPNVALLLLTKLGIDH